MQKHTRPSRALVKKPRYEAAFIFGSVAEGTSNDTSDLDVKVITRQDNPCENINHPSFDDYKLDITFRSFSQIKEFTNDEIAKAEREPNLVRAVIVFDKTGELTQLQQQVRATQPPQSQPNDHQFIQFMLYHANSKVERFLHNDPVSALYSMHANIGDVLKKHFQLHGRWWVSSKNILKNLESWDPALARLVEQFVLSGDVHQKFGHWSAIIDHVASPMGGRQSITENNCNCEICQKDLEALYGSEKV